MDRAARILALIRMRQQARIEIEENPDLSVDITQEIKRGWNEKIALLVAEIKAVTGAW